jgi:amino acid transporter
MLLVTSRMLYGMSRERALPKLLSVLDLKRSTPYIAIAVVSALSVVFLFYGSLEKIASVTSVGSLIIFTNINIALIWLRIKKPHFKRPFRSPLNVGNVPVLAVIGAGMSIFMILQFDLSAAAFGITIAAIGAMFYILRKQKIIPV